MGQNNAESWRSNLVDLCIRKTNFEDGAAFLFDAFPGKPLLSSKFTLVMPFLEWGALKLDKSSK